MLLHRFIDTPLALHQTTAAEMLDSFREKFARTGLEGLLVEEKPAVAAQAVTSEDGTRLFNLVDNIALIPITGVLVHGMTGVFEGESDYGSIERAIVSAADDDRAKAIALQVASPGGEVSGLFELAETIYGVRGKKPIWSILDDHAYSAAYAIASATDKITIPQTGGIGSVGVISMHFDISGLLEQWGIKATIIHYGERKADLSPFQPLSEPAKDRLQTDINTIGEMFVEMVGRNRNLVRKQVRSTEAGVFMGKAGVEQGFADQVLSPQAAFNALVELVS